MKKVSLGGPKGKKDSQKDTPTTSKGPKKRKDRAPAQSPSVQMWQAMRMAWKGKCNPQECNFCLCYHANHAPVFVAFGVDTPEEPVDSAEQKWPPYPYPYKMEYCPIFQYVATYIVALDAEFRWANVH